jgi:hypothetical protein
VTAATAEPVAAASAPTESAGARFPWTRFIHRQSPSTQLGAIQRCHGFVRIRVDRHFDKRETPSLTRVSVLHNLYSIYLAISGKCRIQILLSRLERNVPDINVLQGVLLQ